MRPDSPALRPHKLDISDEMKQVSCTNPQSSLLLRKSELQAGLLAVLPASLNSAKSHTLVANDLYLVKANTLQFSILSKMKHKKQVQGPI